MKKCPRCQHELSDLAKFCPNCGLDLSASLPKDKKKDGPMQNIKRLFAFICLLCLPSLIAILLTNGGNLPDNLNKGDSSVLGDYTGKDATVIVGQYDNLTDFNAKYTNVSSYVNGIVNYENNLASDNNIYNKEYVILVLDNNEIVFHLEYTSRIDDVHELTIVREFNRSHSYNKQEVIYKKENQLSFDELMFTNDELAYIKNYSEDDTKLDPVVNEFNLRKDEFELKKDGLGHFGIGTYHENASFVVKKYGDVYTSIYNFLAIMQLPRIFFKSTNEFLL